MPTDNTEPMDISGMGAAANTAGRQNPQTVAIDMDRLSQQIAENVNRLNQPNLNQTFDNPAYPAHANYRDFTRYLPEFDGTPKTCSLNTFINYCESAQEFVGVITERPIVTLLKSKCKGLACESLESFNVQTIAELISILRNRFIASRPIFAWLTELQTLEQKDKESLLAFYSRVNSHLNQTNQAIDLSKLQNQAGAKDFARDMAIDQFRKGVNIAYRPHIPCVVYQTLESIYKKATEIEKMIGPIETKNTNQSTCLPINQSNNKIQNSRNSTNQSQKPKTDKFCNFCKKTNHVTDDCYALKRQNNSNNPSAPENNKNKVTCHYCKKPGHVINDCRKRAYNNGKNSAKTENKQPGNEAATPRPGASTGQNQ